MIDDDLLLLNAESMNPSKRSERCESMVAVWQARIFNEFVVRAESRKTGSFRGHFAGTQLF